MSDAMQGLATGNRAGKPAGREQTVHTPDVILYVCREVFLGGRIALDPCASRGHEFAVTNTYETGDGLSHPWIDGTYWNPPYKNLKAWMSHAAKQQVEHIGLFPVRPNRQWWCDYMSTEPDAIAWLKPLKFKGYTSGFPAPLVLVYSGDDFETFKTAVTSRKIACATTGPLR